MTTAILILNFIRSPPKPTFLVGILKFRHEGSLSQPWSLRALASGRQVQSFFFSYPNRQILGRLFGTRLGLGRSLARTQTSGGPALVDYRPVRGHASLGRLRHHPGI